MNKWYFYTLYCDLRAFSTIVWNICFCFVLIVLWKHHVNLLLFIIIIIYYYYLFIIIILLIFPIIHVRDVELNIYWNICYLMQYF